MDQISFLVILLCKPGRVPCNTNEETILQTEESNIFNKKKSEKMCNLSCRLIRCLEQSLGKCTNILRNHISKIIVCQKFRNIFINNIEGRNKTHYRAITKSLVLYAQSNIIFCMEFKLKHVKLFDTSFSIFATLLPP